MVSSSVSIDIKRSPIEYTKVELNQLFILNLKKWRKTRGFSQKKLAEKCKTGHSYIRQIESGNRCPSFAYIGKIAGALQIEPYQLFYNEAAKSAKPEHVKCLETVQKKLLESVASDIKGAFTELKNS